MKLRTGKCIKCGREGEYGKPSLSLCPYCNQKRLADGKEATTKKLVFSTRAGFKNPRPKPRKRTTGEAVLFRMVWETRPHQCTNCEANLGSEARTFYFAHILPKSTHPERRLDPLNIRLLCLDCHTAYDHGSEESFNKRTVSKA